MEISAGRWSGKCLIELFHYVEVDVPLAESKIFVIRKAVLVSFGEEAQGPRPGPLSCSSPASARLHTCPPLCGPGAGDAGTCSLHPSRSPQSGTQRRSVPRSPYTDLGQPFGIAGVSGNDLLQPLEAVVYGGFIKGCDKTERQDRLTTGGRLWEAAPQAARPKLTWS